MYWPMQKAAMYSWVWTQPSCCMNVQQNKDAKTPADGSIYQLASTDIYFTAGLAQNTLFFADIVGLSGTPQDADTNGYSARLIQQNDLNLREAWLMMELWNQ